MRSRREGHDALGVSAVWMVALTFVSFFVPAIGGLMGGLAGGWRAGSVRTALKAAVAAAPVAAIGLWLLLAFVPVPFAGHLTRAAAEAWTGVSIFGLLAGAVIGGLGGADEADYRDRTISASGTA